MTMIKKDILCEHLWNHLVVDFRTQEFRMCCKAAPIKTSVDELNSNKKEIFLNSGIVLKAREEMLSGQKTKYCQQCWDIESRGLNSHRTSYDDWEKTVLNPHFPDKKIENLNVSDLIYSKYPNNLDIQLGNICDLKCIYCSDRFSTSWATENNKFGNMSFEKHFKSFEGNSKNHQIIFEESFWALIESTKYSFDRIAFLGGEPLISPNFYQIIEKLVQGYEPQGSKKELNIITNLNTPSIYFEKFLKILPKLSQKFLININVSMEAWDDKAEFIRSGVDFERFKSNFIQLLSLGLKIKFTTITSINIFCLSSLESYLRWIRDLELSYDQTIEVHYNIISYPPFLSLDVADISMSAYTSSAIQFIENEVFTSTPRPSEHWNRYLNSLKMVDQKIKNNKNQDISQINDLKNFINEIKNRRQVDVKNIFTDKIYQNFFSSLNI